MKVVILFICIIGVVLCQNIQEKKVCKEEIVEDPKFVQVKNPVVRYEVPKIIPVPVAVPIPSFTEERFKVRRGVGSGYDRLGVGNVAVPA